MEARQENEPIIHITLRGREGSRLLRYLEYSDSVAGDSLANDVASELARVLRTVTSEEERPT